MSDLISRSALLKKFNDTGIQITFDLPVEEILGDDVDIDDFTMLVQDAIQAYKNMVISTIKEQPAAYNPEKVVEELEKRAEDNLIVANRLQGIEPKRKICEWKGRAGGFKTAIDIVKRGGIYE